MNASNPIPEPQLLYERLSPHRSLSPRGFAILMLTLGAASFVVGLAFLLMGAWPIFGFLGLDVFLVWLAFRANFRSARAFEEILVTPVRLVWRKVSARGEQREDTMNPRWVRLDTTSDELSGVTRIALTERRITRVIGAFLPPVQKERLAKSLASALATAKR
ncbi:MAG: DUF2244 domain-containing protein [Xanthobacteraceae bacterium]|nr:DUF2244 domain-containing protein [Xanthobacteraceae bacterium]QYK45037.1 MAG: DUF2244 domain-containing protein [Xanthobacteraceae bacterium]